jgi:putative ABC transport system permease protein
LVTVLTLALGIGANTAVFSIVNSVLLRSVPIKDADRIVVLWENQLEQGWKREGPLGINYLDWREQNRSFEELTVFEHGSATLTGLGEPEQVPGMRATPNFFAFIGAQPVQGRGFSAEEGKAEGHNVLVISHGFWQRHFGSDAHVLGRTLTVDGLLYTVIGILPTTFWSPIPCEVIAPLSDEKLNVVDRDLGVFGRLKHGVTVEQARVEMNALAQRLEPLRPNRKGWGVTVVPLKDAMVEYIRRQSAARSRHGAPKGNGDSRRVRRDASSGCGSVADGERASGAARRCGRIVAGHLDSRLADGYRAPEHSRSRCGGRGSGEAD